MDEFEHTIIYLYDSGIHWYICISKTYLKSTESQGLLTLWAFPHIIPPQSAAPASLDEPNDATWWAGRDRWPAGDVVDLSVAKWHSVTMRF